ncbi:phospholipase D-like domain-containing protein [Paenibacillus sp. 1P07SE]|uniref:phospholipase D-like domain-containing protein n=1 Tax=Paenibacillus sp. 1P07SE TaxID=3132209 RepID=UPI0039A5BB7E
MAVRFSGSLLTEALEAELAVIRYSGDTVPELALPQRRGTAGPLSGEPSGDTVGVRWVTEGKIKEGTLAMIAGASPGERLWLGMFYLADREVIDAIVEAAQRGVDVRLILDPNENAFGQQKIGLPNRPVAAELLERVPQGLELRWYNTTEEQYHIKTLLIEGRERSLLTTGSTNYTRRNLADLNLEANIEVSAPNDTVVMQSAIAHFERLWHNADAEFTLPYEAYEEKLPWVKQTLYRFQKFFAFTTY